MHINYSTKFLRAVSKGLRKPNLTNPSNSMEVRMQELKNDLGRCKRRFEDLVSRIKEMVAEKQVTRV